MNIKNNESTLNRPQGNRIIQAPEVFVNLPHYVRLIKEEKAWKEHDRNSITVFKNEGLTVIVTALKKNAVIENVQANGFMTLLVLEGKITLKTIDGDVETAVNEMMIFNPHIKYSVAAKDDCCVLLSHYSISEEPGKVF